MGRTKGGIKILAVDSHGVPASVILAEGAAPWHGSCTCDNPACCRHTQESRQRPGIAITENLAQPRESAKDF